MTQTANRKRDRYRSHRECLLPDSPPRQASFLRLPVNSAARKLATVWDFTVCSPGEISCDVGNRSPLDAGRPPQASPEVAPPRQAGRDRDGASGLRKRLGARAIRASDSWDDCERVGGACGRSASAWRTRRPDPDSRKGLSLCPEGQETVLARTLGSPGDCGTRTVGRNGEPGRHRSGDTSHGSNGVSRWGRDRRELRAPEWRHHLDSGV